MAIPQYSNYTIIYNLKEYTKGLYLPTAFVASMNRNDELKYIQKKVSEHSFKDYRIELTPTIQRALGIIERLTLVNLEIKFNTKKRKRKPLLELMQEDRAVKKSIEGYIYRELDALLLSLIHI